MTVILGINSEHAGASAALVVDGVPVAAIAEERLNRIKYYAGFPHLAARRVLDMASLSPADIDCVAIARDPAANLRRKAAFLFRNPERIPALLQAGASQVKQLDLKAQLSATFGCDPASFSFRQVNVEHHLAHIASAYFTSPYDQAAGFSADGSGDFVTCMLASCRGNDIDVLQRIYVPHSLGSLYTMICQFIGYGRYGDEGKVMGLAPYGEDAYREYFNDMVVFTDDGFRLNSRWFQPFGADMSISINERGEMEIGRHYSDHMVATFGAPRQPGDEITQRDMNLARGLQLTFERVWMHLLQRLHTLTKSDRVVMAGGCALNSVANGLVSAQTPFNETWIHPAAGDDGLSLGAALYAAQSSPAAPPRYVMGSAGLGPEFSQAQIRNALKDRGVEALELPEPELLARTAAALEAGQVVGWFQRRMEWGPRALGNRSILAHPGLPQMKQTLNDRIKRREWFRPFAPAVLEEAQAKIFECGGASPHMLHVYRIRDEWRDRLRAVAHVDQTGRLQTVIREHNPRYHALLRAFEARTGLPVLVNTSFNENEPIVCSPEEAIDCFLRTHMDLLVIGDSFCEKPSSGA
ncbi:MAG: carbamoyltransferase [Chloroflexota bacterium]|nr:carbamoyltransferase [Chloroflexota bacterium]